MRERTDELARVMTLEGGKPLIENSDEVGWTAAAFDYYAEMGRNFAGRVIPSIEATQLALVLKEPMGVVGAIVPVELPPAAALVEARAGAGRRQHRGGQAVRAHPHLDPDAAPSASSRCPPGAVDMLAGAGDVGEAIVSDERVDCVAFTGLGRDRQEDRRALRRARGAHQPGDGRQGPVHRLRRRGRRRRGGRARAARGPPTSTPARCARRPSASTCSARSTTTSSSVRRPHAARCGWATRSTTTTDVGPMASALSAPRWRLRWRPRWRRAPSSWSAAGDAGQRARALLLARRW